jgi:hypothetical protein
MKLLRSPKSGRLASLLPRISLAAVGFTLTVASTVWAQGQDPLSQGERETIQHLVERVEELESQVKQLKAELSKSTLTMVQTAPVVEGEKPEDRGEVSAEASSIHQKTADESLPQGTPRSQLHWFADVGYRASDAKGARTAFLLGQVDLFTTSRLSERTSVLAEIVMKANSDNRFVTNVERILLQYSPSDYFNIAAGRYHTAVGYYNTQYHHGAWFETAASRPLIFAPTGGLIPIHNVGVTVNGRIPSGGLGLRYLAEIGNGQASRSPTAEPTQNLTDEDNHKAFNLGILARPAWSPGLQAGFSVYRDRLMPPGSPSLGHTLMAAHLILRTSSYEWLSEVMVARNDLGNTGLVYHTPGFYVQGARRFDRLWPYFRYQYVNAPSGDPVFGSLGRRQGPSFGVRFDIDEFAAFKLQYDRLERRQLDAINSISAQLAFTF